MLKENTIPELWKAQFLSLRDRNFREMKGKYNMAVFLKYFTLLILLIAITLSFMTNFDENLTLCIVVGSVALVLYIVSVCTILTMNAKIRSILKEENTKSASQGLHWAYKGNKLILNLRYESRGMELEIAK